MEATLFDRDGGYLGNLSKMKMNMLRGGNTCGCGCDGPSGDEDNYSSNWDGNLYSPGGNQHCSWPGSGDVTVYGGSKAPGMP